ncbi:hypothetical protein PsalBI1_04506 (plasmid) [Piscirickettsia salmonis]|nr:hypothetical protein PsalBI1_04506 [Piscirickettsia salmonis]
MECADSRHVTLCDADSRGFIVVAFCSAILHHWMCKIPTEVATLTKAMAQPYVKPPRVVNVDKHASFPPAHQKAKDEGVFSSQCKLRRVKYLNNGIENDHKAVKRKSRFRQWYQSLSTARSTIDVMERPPSYEVQHPVESSLP